MEILSAEEQVAHAREIYNKGDYKQAAHEFSVARKSFETQNLPIKVAEMANNQSVALLKSGNPQGALDIVLGTEIVFEKENERKAKVACMGLSFKPDIDDLRESPALFITKRLIADGLEVLAVEPNIETYKDIEIVDYKKAIEKADIVTFLVAHKEFKGLDIKSELDFCGVLRK